MANVQTNKPVMAEMLVRAVLGSTSEFERACQQRGVSIQDAVTQALQNWVGSRLTLVGAPSALSPDMVLSALPAPQDCPPGEEEHWLRVCEHDLGVLREQQRRCFAAQDQEGIARTTRAIESYLQVRAELRERVA
jgi:hypothetical protein